MKLAIGLMSGTSMDGIDAVLMKTDGKQVIESISTCSLEYQPEFKRALRTAEESVRAAKKNNATQAIIDESTRLHAQIVIDLLKKASINANEVDLIGYHGQALYHQPDQGITIQIGNGQLLADLTQIAVINDFRSDDIRNGGQGAPLAPLYHQAILLNKNYLPAAIVNCGGIANISIISGAGDQDVIGFDTGPGNVLIDRYIRQKTNDKEFIDLDGKYGLKGIVDEQILAQLIDLFLPYLSKEFPKSLDPSYFNLIPEINTLSIHDACATLENFTAFCIAYSLPVDMLPKKWLLAGGGWSNPVIRSCLNEYLSQRLKSVEVKLASEIGLDSTYMEAELFAYLAVRSFKKLHISLPLVTGASIASIGGTLYLPA